MSYETPYNTGSKPFTHDKQRGKWASPADFLFACIGNAFKADSLLFMRTIVFRELGIYALIPYVMVLAVCVVPMVFIQSFLGQFSGTGFISAFNVAPSFKGIGYVSLALNFLTLCYYSLFSAIPMFFLYHTVEPLIPWSCEEWKRWIMIKPDTNPVCLGNLTMEDHSSNVEMPSVDFFKTHVNPEVSSYDTQFSWLLMLCSFIVWGVVLVVIVMPVETIGRIIKYTIFVIVGVTVLLLARFLFMPHAVQGLRELFMPIHLGRIDTWLTLPLMALGTLGPGWGSIVTMASFNDFKANIYKYSWIMSLVQMGTMLVLAIMSMLIWGFIQQGKDVIDVGDVSHYGKMHEFLAIPTGLTSLELPHFWSVIFFMMLILGSMILLIVQLLSVLTSIFDEFESLRTMKSSVRVSMVAFLSVFSIFFCTNHGINFLQFLAKSALMTQMLLNLLMILVVLWIHGREKFQRDVKFMTSRLYSTSMTNMVRFVTPLFLMLGLLIGINIAIEHIWSKGFGWIPAVFGAALMLIPWCLFLWYFRLKHEQTSEVIGEDSVKLTDWFPADPLDKQRYEETLGNPEAAQQLTAPEEGIQV